ncbi:MAG: tRNA-binding protein [Gaiellaceae bacterium]
MEPTQALEKLDLVVGRIREAGPHPGARAPSYLLRIDLGGRGTREASIEAGAYDAAELVGSQVVCGARGDEILVLAARSRAHGIVLLRPDREVENGTAIG